MRKGSGRYVAKSQMLEIVHLFFIHLINVDLCDSLKGLVYPLLRGIWKCVAVTLVVMVTGGGEGGPGVQCSQFMLHHQALSHANCPQYPSHRPPAHPLTVELLGPWKEGAVDTQTPGLLCGGTTPLPPFSLFPTRRLTLSGVGHYDLCVPELVLFP